MGRSVPLLLSLLIAGCASASPPQPQVAATQPAAPEPVAATPVTTATPVATATPQPATAQPVASQPVASQPVASAPVASAPVASAPAPKPIAPPAPPPTRAAAAPPIVRTPAPKPAAPPVAAPRAAASTPTAIPTAAPTLDLDALEARLRATKAIGVFTKISLKNKVDDLMKQFAAHYQGNTKPTKAELRQSYDLLMMKVLSLLQDADPPLAMAVVSSREAIWAVLANEKTFAALQI